MNKVPILQVVDDPATAEPECDSYFVRIILKKTGKYEWWALKFAGKIDGRVMQVEKDFDFGNAAQVLGRMHNWGLSTNDFPKYVLLTKESADILQPLMNVPVFQYTTEVPAVES